MGKTANMKHAKSAKADKKKKKKLKKLRLFLKIFLLAALLCILAVLVVFYFKFGDELLQWKSEAKRAVEESTVETFRASETSIIYSSNKSVIAKLKGDKDSYYLIYENIPQYAKDAMIATEDREFEKHDGVNLLSTFKAALLLVKSKIMGEDISRGGSTITQQTAKLVFLTNEQTYERKIREIFIAFEMEKKYRKSQIMEFYMNNIYFSNGYYGIEAAARGYFSRPASKLDLSEIVFLCAIPNNPSLYDPFDNFDNTIARRNRMLKQMLEEGFINAAEYSDACYEDIILDPADAIKTQNYMTTYAIRCATKALMQAQGFEFQYKFEDDEEKEAYDKDYDELYNECNKSLHTGGYRIYTSLNKKKQRIMQQTIDSRLSSFTEKNEGVYKLQGAATCIDNKTGYVVAIVGGRKQKSITGYTLNRAFQSYRQPGSSFKPIVVYTPQLERNYTPDSIVDDSYFEGGPKNSNGSYSGSITLRSAVENSKNVVAWKLFEELTPEVGLSYAYDMNFNRIVRTDYVPAASLGGLTNGVTTVEMASAYATICNGGVFRDPTCIKKITDSNGNTIVNNNEIRKEKRVYKKDAAMEMTDILTGVPIRGTAAGHALKNMACAGKTGTTSDKKDGWFCGFTPYYTTAAWVGYDDPQPLSDLYGSTYPLYIWEDFMNAIHEGLEYKDFESSDGSSHNDSSYSGGDGYYDDGGGYEDAGGGYEYEDEGADEGADEWTSPPVDENVNDEEKPKEKRTKEPAQKPDDNQNPEPTTEPDDEAGDVVDGGDDGGDEPQVDVGVDEKPTDVGNDEEPE